MKLQKSITKIVSILTLVIIVSAFSLTISKAFDSSCPSGYSDQDCLNYLKAQSDAIKQQRDAAGAEVSRAEYEKLDLNAKINYLNSQISAKNAVINTMELDIETKNVEIRIIGKSINAIQENISTLTQETNQLKDTIGKRVSLSYKYDKMSPIEVMFSADNFDTMLRKTKYLLEARKHDRDELEQLSYNVATLKSEEQELNNKKADIQTKRNEVEIQKTDIFTQKQALLPKQTELNNLIAEKQRKIDEGKSIIATLTSQQNEIDNQVQALIMEMYHKGHLGNGVAVAKGQIIGFQGHTGCSIGSHLHFGMTQGGNEWSANVDPFASSFLNGGSWYGAYLSSKNGNSPMDGAVVTQGFHQGMNLDLISTTAGDQSGNSYWIPEGYISSHCHGYYDYTGWASLTGEGAPVYAVLSGTVYYGVEDWGGANFALVNHGNGLVSLYLHLRD
jgi:peptidoglycan hydrolase CwlO-like protein